MSNNSLHLKLVERERKDFKRNSLITRISRLGFKIAPYSFYIRCKHHYMANSKESSRYIEYIRHCRPRYNFTNKLPSSYNWDTIN